VLERLNAEQHIQLIKEHSISVETESGAVLIYGEDIDIDGDTLKRLTSYVDQEAFSKKSPSEGDCAHIAGEAVNYFRSFFEARGYAIGTIGTVDTTGKKIPLYSQLGYGHHIINFLEAEDMVLAFDLTSSYTLPLKTKPAVFIVAADDIELLMRRLKDVTGVKWEIR